MQKGNGDKSEAVSEAQRENNERGPFKGLLNATFLAFGVTLTLEFNTLDDVMSLNHSLAILPRE